MRKFTRIGPVKQLLVCGGDMFDEPKDSTDDGIQAGPRTRRRRTRTNRDANHLPLKAWSISANRQRLASDRRCWVSDTNPVSQAAASVW